MNLKTAPDKICRVCLCETDQVKSVCDPTEDDDGKTILECIEFVVNIKINVHNKLPSQICNNCEFTLYAAESFKQRCLNSERILSEQLSNETGKLPVPVTVKLEPIKVEIELDSDPYIIDPDPVPTEADNSVICKTETIFSSPTKVFVLPTVVDQAKRMIIKNKQKKTAAGSLIKNAVYCPPKQGCDVSTKLPQKGGCHLVKSRLLERFDVTTSPHKEGSDADKSLPTPEINVDTSLNDQRPKTDTSLRPKHVCPTCKREYKFLWHLQNHITLVHVKTDLTDQDFRCEVCKKIFPKHLLKNHAQIHFRENQAPFICPYCGKELKNKFNLDEHIRRHKGEKPFPCDKCDSRFVSKLELKLHNRKHTDERPFSCKYCGMKFRVTCSLKRHLRTHTGEKPFTCDVCPRRFRESGARNDHQRSVHLGVRPFHCDHCELKFSGKKDLRRHLRRVAVREAKLAKKSSKSTEAAESTPATLEELLTPAVVTTDMVTSHPVTAALLS